MRVFTPAEAKNAADIRLNKDASRAQNILEATREILAAKNEAERSFEETMKKQQDIAAAWFEETTTKKNAVLREVERLEDRRRKALKPPLIKAEDIHTFEEKLWARKLELDALEDEHETRGRELMQRLDECSTQQNDLDKREKRIKIMELATEDQKNKVASDLRHLNMQLAEFYKTKEEAEMALAFQKSELDAQAKLQKEKEDGFIERENEIQAAMRLLADQRFLLEKGFEELRKTKLKHT